MILNRYAVDTMKTVKLSIDEEKKIGRITLNRPDKLNAINNDMRKEFPEALETFREDNNVRVVVVDGAGDRAFCVGADITEFGEMKPQVRAFRRLEMCDRAEEFPKPVIAAIDGYALGGGLELAMACDFRIASKRSELGQPEINLAIIPGGGGTQRLPRLVGMTRAKEMVMTGDRISAEKAHEWGLVNKAVKTENFEEEVEKFASRLARGPPIALTAAKRVMNKGMEIPLDQALELESEAVAMLLTTEDMKEGASAFMEKREPEFKGE